MEFRQATQEDLDFVRHNPFEDAVKGYPYMQCPDDNTYTGIHNSVILGVFGVQVIWEGRGQFWLMMVDDFKEHINGMKALLIMKQKVNWLIEKNKLWRAEAIIRPDFPQAIKMIEFLGFKRESMLEKYMPDKTDGYLYVRII